MLGPRWSIGRRARDLVNRRIAFALILTLLVRSLLPGLAMALSADPSSPTTLEICTGDGIKEIVLDANEQDPRPQHDQAPQMHHCCPCCVLCGGCALLLPGRIGLAVAYAAAPVFRLQPESDAPVTARAPPAHRSRAPPILS